MSWPQYTYLTWVIVVMSWYAAVVIRHDLGWQKVALRAAQVAGILGLLYAGGFFAGGAP